MSKEERIQKEKERLWVEFDSLTGANKTLAEQLVNNASFMAVTLEDLQNIINEQGAVITQKNGNGFVMLQEHPAQKSYNQMIGKYNTLINQLTKMVGGASQSQSIESLMDDLMDNE